MLSVYRIEGADHLGPYYSGEAFGGYRGVHPRENPYGCDKNTRHPRPSADDLSWHDVWPYNLNIVFGFTSLRQLGQWFNSSERTFLHNHNYRLAIYRVRKGGVQIETKQCLFRRDMAEFVRHAMLRTEQ